jgi:nitrogen fixation NifU-like protein
VPRDHFTHPRRIGTLPGADGIGVFADPGCEDVFTVYIRVKRGRLADVRCQVAGCRSAVACASALASLSVGKTLDQALKVRNEDILQALGGQPDPADPRPNLGADALHRAIYDYLGRCVPSEGWTYWIGAVGEVTRVAEVSEAAPPTFPRLAEVSVFPRFVAALDGVEEVDRLWISWWLHELPPAARETLKARPLDDPGRPERGVFSLRSPSRPNPIGLALVGLVARQENRLLVDGLDARVGAPIIDIKPWSERDARS